MLIFTFAEVLEEIVKKLVRRACAGCDVNHPSQNRHFCLMESAGEKLERHFGRAYESFKYKDVLQKYRENVQTINSSAEEITRYFILHVLMLDKLRHPTSRNTVYQLMEKRTKQR